MRMGETPPNDLQSDRFVLTIVGLPPIYFNKVSGLGTEYDVKEMPDGTVRPTGNKKSGTLTVEIFPGDTLSYLGMMLWIKMCEPIVAPTAIKSGVLLLQDASESNLRMWRIIKTFPKKWSISDLEKKSAAEPVKMTIELAFAKVEMLL
jgi:phage tail-like protein